LGPGRPARAGEAVTTPPSRPRSAPSARSLQPALWRSPPSAPPHCGPVPGISSSRRTHRGGHSRHRPLYHPLRAASITSYLLGSNLNSSLTTLYLRAVGPRKDRGRCSLTARRSCWAPTCAGVTGPARSCGEERSTGRRPTGQSRWDVRAGEPATRARSRLAVNRFVAPHEPVANAGG